jgi:GDP-L-fucose synthase
MFINNNNITDDLINIGSGVEISIKKLAEKIQKIVGFEGKLDFDKNMPDGNPRKLLDSSKIKSYGWSPEINLDVGLSSAYNWYKEHI